MVVDPRVIEMKSEGVLTRGEVQLSLGKTAPNDEIAARISAVSSGNEKRGATVNPSELSPSDSSSSLSDDSPKVWLPKRYDREEYDGKSERTSWSSESSGMEIPSASR